MKRRIKLSDGTYSQANLIDFTTLESIKKRIKECELKFDKIIKKGMKSGPEKKMRKYWNVEEPLYDQFKKYCEEEDIMPSDVFMIGILEILQETIKRNKELETLNDD